MPRIEATVTLGNLLSIGTVIVAITLAWGRMESRMTEVDLRASNTAVALDALRAERQASVAAMEARVRTLETAGARFDAQLRSIESLLTRIDSRLERMEERRSQP